MCSSCGKNKNVAYEVRFKDGTTQRYTSMAEAQQAQQRAGGVGTSIRAVAK
jgi:hypothetical protein